MTPLEWFSLLLVVGLVLLVAEFFLPTHGMLGIAGMGTLMGAIGVLFYMNQWAGLAVLLLCAITAPFVGVWLVRVWPRTPVGRRIVLQPIESRPDPLLVQIGQSGVTISELRPMGTCEFDGRRLEALSEQGIIPAGQPVRVVDLNNRRPVVRAV